MRAAPLAVALLVTVAPAALGVVDLLDTAGSGANTYQKNKFGTEDFQ